MTDARGNLFSMTTLLLAGALTVTSSGAEAASRTLGFVVPKWSFAGYQSKFWDECPEGAAISQDEVWWRAASKEVRSRVTNNGNLDANVRLQVPNHRGPNGEDVCWRPTLFKDPPIRQASGPISYGFNLDGAIDGQVAPGTCGHEKFPTSPNGETQVDNQLFRAIGCHVGWRNFAIVDSYANEGRKSSGNGIVLIEVTGVDDAQNDDDVEVSFYKAVPAQFPRDPAGNILPFGSYHIETAKNVPRYVATTHGKIAKGVLSITPRDVTLPYYGTLGAYGEMTFRKANLRLEIAADGKSASGLVGGIVMSKVGGTR